MKNLFKTHRVLSIITVIVLVLVIGTTVFAATYSLNKTIPATVTITTPTPQPVEVTLYTDALCTTPIPNPYTHNFGSVVEGGTQQPLWFKAAQITPSTINVTTSGLPGDAQVQFLVGTPINSQPGKPCTLALWLPSDLPTGGPYNFNFTVTGSGSD